MSQHYTRKALERKDELRLYEWLKENYPELQGKTVSEGAAVIVSELGLDVSPNTVVSMVRDMDMEPFWRARSKQQPEQVANGQDGGELAQVLTRLEQLVQICENLVERVERLELELATRPDGASVSA